VHSTPPRRPSSVPHKRTDDSFHRNQTPAPLFSKKTQRSKSRRHWPPITETKIKTEQGSIIAQISHLNSHHKHQFQPPNNQITYRLNVDQSWMPNWYTNPKSNETNSDLCTYLILVIFITEKLFSSFIS
jgi:hypothetical protein